MWMRSGGDADARRTVRRCHDEPVAVGEPGERSVEGRTTIGRRADRDQRDVLDDRSATGQPRAERADRRPRQHDGAAGERAHAATVSLARRAIAAATSAAASAASGTAIVSRNADAPAAAEAATAR